MVTYTFFNGTVADANQVNTNFADVENNTAKLGTNIAESAYKTLKAAGSFENGDDIMADRFTSAAGVNATVDTTNSTALFNSTKYQVSGTGDGNNDTENGGQTFTTSGATTGQDGFRVLVLNNCVLISVTKSATCTGTTARIRDATNTITIASATFSGNVATFSGIKPLLIAGNTYNIDVGSGGSSYTAHYTGTPTYPVTGTNLRMVSNTSGATTTSYNISSMITQNATVTSPVTVILNSNTLQLNGSETTIACYGNTQGSLISSGTGDGVDDTVNYTLTQSYTGGGPSNLVGNKFQINNNILLKQVKVPYYNSATNGSSLKIYSGSKSLIKTFNNQSLTTGTADGVDDSHTMSASAWVTSGGTSSQSGVCVKVNNSCFVKSVTKEASQTATTAYIIRDNIIIGSAVFSGSVATFSPYPFLEKDGVYFIHAGSDGTATTNRFSNGGESNSFSADLTRLGKSSATYVSTTKTSGCSYTSTALHERITGITTQTASADSTRYFNNIDFTLEAGKSYYIMEDLSTYLGASDLNSVYTVTYPVAGTDFNLVGAAYSTSITDITTAMYRPLGLITQNITGSLTPITSLKFNISDGTTTTSDVTANSQGKAVVNVSALGGGTMKVTAKLETTDTSLTPELYGVGVNIIR